MPQHTTQSVKSRLLGEFLLAEIYLVEATIESAVAIRNGLSRARGRGNPNAGDNSLGSVWRETGRELVEPYSVRYAHLRKIIATDWQRQ